MLKLKIGLNVDILIKFILTEILKSVYILYCLLYNEVMKKRLKNNNDKLNINENEECNICLNTKGDVSIKQEFTQQDLES